MASAPLSLVGIDGAIWRIERDRNLSVMPVLHQVFGRVRKGYVRVKITALLGESFDPPVGRQTVIVTCVAND